MTTGSLSLIPALPDPLPVFAKQRKILACRSAASYSRTPTLITWGPQTLSLRELPGVELVVGQRESRLLRKDSSLDAGEKGKRLFGYPGGKSRPTRVLKERDRVGSLQAIFSPGHSPGHMSFLDVRDGSLIAGDAFTTQIGVIVAGVFKFYFPFSALFSWNREVAAESARKLRTLKPERLAVGHGRTIESPLAAMDQAIELAFRQCGKMLN